MACKLSMQCDLIFGILKCTLPEDTIDVDLNVCTLRGIHTFGKDRTQIIKCRPWGTMVKPYPSLKKKIAEFMKGGQTITTPFANRSFQPRHQSSSEEMQHGTIYQTNQGKTFSTQKSKCRTTC